MKRTDPHFRAYAALEAFDAKNVVTDPKIQELLNVIQGTSKNEALCYAWDKFTHEYSRTVLDSFLLANATYDVIRKTTGVPIPVLQVYSSHIFDLTVFRDYLERVEYVGFCKQYLHPREQAYLEAALTQGADYIVWLLNGKIDKPPKAALEAAMIEGMLMGQAHRNVDITSETAKQSRAWLDVATRAATSLQRIDPKDDQDAFMELQIALTHENNVVNAETPAAPQPEEILH